MWLRLSENSRFFHKSLAIVGFFAVALRLWHAYRLEQALGDTQVFDAEYYLDEARHLLGELPAFPKETLRFANYGYSRALALVFGVFGAGASAASVALRVQAVLGGVCVVLLGLFVERLFSDRQWAFVSALLWAFYAPAIYFDAALLIPAANTFLVILALFALAHALTGTFWVTLWAATCCGVSLGLAVLLRASNVLVWFGLVGVLVYSWARKARNLTSSDTLAAHATSAASVTRPRPAENWFAPRHWGVLVGGISLSALLVVGIPLAQSYAASGVWLPLSANGGMNLWLGNQHAARGVYYVAPFLQNHDREGRVYTIINERNAYLAEARRRTQDVTLDLAGSSRFWRQQAFAEIAESKGRWLGLEWRKFVYFCNQYEAWTNLNFDFVARFSGLLKYNPLRFGVILGLGLWGLVLIALRRSRFVALVLGCFVGGPCLTSLIFFVSGEYRHPASPVLALGVAFAILEWARKGWQRGLNSARVPAWPVLLGFAVLCFWPVEAQSQVENFKAFAEKMVSPSAENSLPSLEDYTRAERLIQHAGSSQPEQVITKEVLLLILSNRAIQFRDLDAAERLVRVAKELWQLAPRPEEHLSAATVSRVYRNLRRRITQLGSQPFITAEPRLEAELAFLGAHDYAEVGAYLRLGKTKEAREFLSQALKSAPHSVELLTEFGRLELLAGNAEAGVAWLDKGLRAWPPRALPALLLAQHFLRLGDWGRAKSYFAEAKKREPEARDVRALGQLLGG